MNQYSIILQWSDEDKLFLVTISEFSDRVICSWEGYTKNVVEESRPEKIIVIGKDVAGVLENDLKNISNGNYSVIAQPNARLSAEQHLANYIKYYTLCHE